MYTRNVTQGINTDPQRQTYPQAFNHPAIDNRVDPRSLFSPYTLPGASSDGFYPGRIQYPSEISQQQITRNSSNTSSTGMVPQNTGAPHVGAADNTTRQSVIFQSSSISNPNNVSSLYGHSTNPTTAPVQLDENASSLSYTPIIPVPPPPITVSNFTVIVKACDISTCYICNIGICLIAMYAQPEGAEQVQTYQANPDCTCIFHMLCNTLGTLKICPKLNISISASVYSNGYL